MGDRFTVFVSDSDERAVRCQNCRWKGKANETAPINHLEMRIAPGEIVPVGECPTCGALAHLASVLVASG